MAWIRYLEILRCALHVQIAEFCNGQGLLSIDCLLILRWHSQGFAFRKSVVYFCFLRVSAVAGIVFDCFHVAKTLACASCKQPFPFYIVNGKSHLTTLK